MRGRRSSGERLHLFDVDSEVRAAVVVLGEASVTSKVLRFDLCNVKDRFHGTVFIGSNSDLEL